MFRLVKNSFVGAPALFGFARKELAVTTDHASDHVARQTVCVAVGQGANDR